MVDFSVIIATYNRADYLRECLNSLVMQTHKNFEAIVADDGSTDNTENVINEFKKLLNLKYFKISNSGFPGKPRNLAVKEATSDWLCFLDSDDKWSKDKLKACLPYLNSYDVIYHRLQYFGTGKPFYRTVIPSRQVHDPVFVDLMTNGNNIALSSSLIRKNIFLDVGGFFDKNSSIGGLDDYDLWLKTSLKTSRFKFIAETLGFYRIHQNNMTETSYIQINKINIVYEKYLPQLNLKYHKEAAIIKNYYIAIVYERMKEYKKAMQLCKASMQSNNINLKIKSVLRILLIIAKKIVR